MGVYLPAPVSQVDGCSLGTKSLSRVTNTSVVRQVSGESGAGIEKPAAHKGVVSGRGAGWAAPGHCYVI